MFNTKNAKKPVIIRKEYKEVRPTPAPLPPRQPQKKRIPTGRHPSLSTPAQAIARDKSRNGATNGKVANGGEERLRVPGASKKRQRNGTPVGGIDWGNSDSSEQEEDTWDAQKRKRVLDSSSAEPDTKRDIWTIGDVVTESDLEGLIHAADLTSGKLEDITGLRLDKYKEVFERAEGEEIPVVELQYPSNSPPER